MSIKKLFSNTRGEAASLVIIVSMIIATLGIISGSRLIQQRIETQTKAAIPEGPIGYFLTVTAPVANAQYYLPLQLEYRGKITGDAAGGTAFIDLKVYKYPYNSITPLIETRITNVPVINGEINFSGLLSGANVNQIGDYALQVLPKDANGAIIGDSKEIRFSVIGTPTVTTVPPVATNTPIPTKTPVPPTKTPSPVPSVVKSGVWSYTLNCANGKITHTESTNGQYIGSYCFDITVNGQPDHSGCGWAGSSSGSGITGLFYQEGQEYTMRGRIWDSTKTNLLVDESITQMCGTATAVSPTVPPATNTPAPTTPPTIKRPDMTIKSATTSFDRLGNMTLTTVFSNIGSAAVNLVGTNKMQMVVGLDAATPQCDANLSISSIAGLAAGASLTERIDFTKTIGSLCPSFTPQPGKKYLITLRVDPADIIKEENEVNNTFVLNFTQPGTAVTDTPAITKPPATNTPKPPTTTVTKTPTKPPTTTVTKPPTITITKTPTITKPPTITTTKTPTVTKTPTITNPVATNTPASTLKLADVTIKSATATFDRLGNMTLATVFSNIGKIAVGNAGPYKMEMAVGLTAATTECDKHLTVDIAGLTPGASITQNIDFTKTIGSLCPNFTPQPGKKYLLTMRVDSTDLIKEENEVNNSFVTNFTQPGGSTTITSAPTQPPTATAIPTKPPQATDTPTPTLNPNYNLIITAPTAHSQHYLPLQLEYRGKITGLSAGNTSHIDLKVYKYPYNSITPLIETRISGLNLINDEINFNGLLVGSNVTQYGEYALQVIPYNPTGTVIGDSKEVRFEIIPVGGTPTDMPQPGTPTPTPLRPVCADLQLTGDSSVKYDVIFLPSGYTDYSKFESDARTAMAYYKGAVPDSGLQGKYNFKAFTNFSNGYDVVACDKNGRKYPCWNSIRAKDAMRNCNGDAYVILQYTPIASEDAAKAAEAFASYGNVNGISLGKNTGEMLVLRYDLSFVRTLVQGRVGGGAGGIGGAFMQILETILQKFR